MYQRVSSFVLSFVSKNGLQKNDSHFDREARECSSSNVASSVMNSFVSSLNSSHTVTVILSILWHPFSNKSDEDNLPTVNRRHREDVTRLRTSIEHRIGRDRDSTSNDLILEHIVDNSNNRNSDHVSRRVVGR